MPKLAYQDAEGFIFDCDGTLIDSLAAWDDAERALFAQAGALTEEQEDEIHSAPIERAAALFHERYGVLGSAQAVLEHLDGHLIPFYSQRARALPGACELVRALSAAGIPCVVVSSSPRRYLEAGLGRLGIASCFRELVTTDETGCSKQQPGIYERAVQILGSPVDRTWAVDDAPYAIAAMHAFGLNTICVGGRAAPGADLNVSSLEELVSGADQWA